MAPEGSATLSPLAFCGVRRTREFTVDYVVQSGLRRPIRFAHAKPPGLVVPDSSFTVADVRDQVGQQRMVDVMDVRTQEGLAMSLKEWVDYYTDEQRDTLLNVISLEFSRSRLDPSITTPAMVRMLDWVDTVWPADLKAQQRDDTNQTRTMKYPKASGWVQKYCLMSVAGCYTDFHIDFGGSSVWYHIVKGAKAGDTFMIPTGWIHGVYTPEDSLVFGGNFLHSLNIDGQLQIAAMERRLKVPLTYRFPFFEELMWYAADRYVRVFAAATHQAPVHQNPLPLRSNLTSWELMGLNELLANLRVWIASPAHRAYIPRRLKNPSSLIDSLQKLLQSNPTAGPGHRRRVVESSDEEEDEEPSKEKVKEKELKLSGSAGHARQGTLQPELSPAAPSTTSFDRAHVRAAETTGDQPDLDAQDTRRYCQIKAVREALQRQHGAASSAELDRLAELEWLNMDVRSRRAYRELFEDSLAYAAAVSGEMGSGTQEELMQASTRSRKYEGARWRSSKTHFQRAQALQAMRRVPYSEEAEDVKERRLEAAKALFATPFGGAAKSASKGSLSSTKAEPSIIVQPSRTKSEAQPPRSALAALLAHVSSKSSASHSKAASVAPTTVSEPAKRQEAAAMASGVPPTKKSLSVTPSSSGFTSRTVLEEEENACSPPRPADLSASPRLAALEAIWWDSGDENSRDSVSFTEVQQPLQHTSIGSARPWPAGSWDALLASHASLAAVDDILARAQAVFDETALTSRATYQYGPTYR
ncbi:uncharacterized protein MONBRDRAFT_25364 [Monosiga brevicollis MX1]|uniref:JmjC domain-containing protein n=1 Tax=Monosiga brevicollis TaxID=81824 RepID=A9UZ72_MONBE|nr:uncharacterized protein MONBRDRAFT_25364 [Monosiga brevicollis MX1]EDQ89316.1 predicted protein [Monosiga brevicollis MX1]|eukprot:XP_001745892.1 hypothetical protein [Monosiga brevicollis MX1]